MNYFKDFITLKSFQRNFTLHASLKDLPSGFPHLDYVASEIELKKTFFLSINIMMSATSSIFYARYSTTASFAEAERAAGLSDARAARQNAMARGRPPVVDDGLVPGIHIHGNVRGREAPHV